MKLLIWLIALAALAMGMTIAVAGPGARLEFWDYSTGLGLIRKVSRPITIVEDVVALSPIFTAAALSLIGAVIAFATRAAGLGVFAMIAAVFAGATGMVPIKMRELVQGNPFIHEITTDFSDPPPIIAGADSFRKNPADYRGDETVRDTEMTVAEAQRAAFPDIQSQLVAGSVDENAEIVTRVIESMGLEILSNAPTEDGWLIEATYTSTWFGFIDDFVVRLRPEGAMTRVDVRSKSRVGGSDLGANARRTQDFYARLETAAS